MDTKRVNTHLELQEILKKTRSQMLVFGCSSWVEGEDDSRFLKHKMDGYTTEVYTVKTQNMKECGQKFVSFIGEHDGYRLNRRNINSKGEIKDSKEKDGFFYAILYFPGIKFMNFKIIVLIRFSVIH